MIVHTFVTIAGETDRKRKMSLDEDNQPEAKRRKTDQTKVILKQLLGFYTLQAKIESSIMESHMVGLLVACIRKFVKKHF